MRNRVRRSAGGRAPRRQLAETGPEEDDDNDQGRRMVIEQRAVSAMPAIMQRPMNEMLSVEALEPSPFETEDDVDDI